MLFRSQAPYPLFTPPLSVTYSRDVKPIQPSDLALPWKGPLAVLPLWTLLGTWPEAFMTLGDSGVLLYPGRMTKGQSSHCPSSLNPPPRPAMGVWASGI